MANEVIDYEGGMYCKFADQEVVVMKTHQVYSDGSTDSNKARVLCPYYKSGIFTNHACQKGGSCGIAEAMS